MNPSSFSSVAAGFLVLLVIPCGAVWAQGEAGSPAARQVLEWGVLIDPSGTAEARVTGSGRESMLTIVADSNSTRLSNPLGTAPRVMNPVWGDFAFQVRVAWAGARDHRWRGSRIGFGPRLILYEDDDQYFSVTMTYRDYEDRDGQLPFGLWVAANPDGDAPTQQWTNRIQQPEAWVRIERQGDSIRAYFGYDDGNWMSLYDTHLVLPDTLHFGFLLPNQSRSRMTASFQSLSVDRNRLPDSLVTEDPYRVEQRRSSRWLTTRMFLVPFLVGLTLLILVGAYWIGIGRLGKSTPYGSMESPMTRGQHFLAYLLSFAATFTILLVLVMVGSRDGYLPWEFGVFVMFTFSPVVAVYSMAWIPLGEWYGRYLGWPERPSDFPPKPIYWVGLVLCFLASIPGFWLGGGTPTAMLVAFGAVAVGGTLYFRFTYLKCGR